MTKSPQFRNMIKEIAKGNVLVPILHAYLFDAVYPEFDVHFSGGSSHRAPDAWFHPSTHPMMPARQLYYYMTSDKRLIAEPLEYMGALSTTMGTAVHGFVQMCLKDHGVLLEDEVYVEHPATKSRGSMDGILKISGWGTGGFEFKTSNMQKLNGFNDNDVVAFKTKWPRYYGQVQEYMRISGLRQFVVLFMGMGYPWTLKECQIDFDPAFAFEIEKKYTTVLRHLERGVPPEPCCAPKSKEAAACFARALCPIGMIQ
jgi:hypothetical protein